MTVTERCLCVCLGESGKSTLLKQMRSLYGKKTNVSPDELMLQRASVFQTILSSMAALLKASEKYVPLANEDLKKAKEHIISQHASIRGSFSGGALMNDDIKDMLIALWNDEGIRQTWENHRSEIQTQESLEYFMKDGERVLHADFEVTEMDWLRARVRTTGVITEKFLVEGVPFTVIDVGGQRNERKKWIHVFSNVTSIIYVSAINEYDEVLFEQTDMNRMQESLNLFEEMVNHDEFMDSGMILFLNKSDLFKRKLKQFPIAYIDPKDPTKNRWEDYTGPSAVGLKDTGSPEFIEAYNAGIEYFTNKFYTLNRHPSTKGKPTTNIHPTMSLIHPNPIDIYVHVTCAMDRVNVDAVLGACWDIILRKVLNQQGFLRD